MSKDNIARGMLRDPPFNLNFQNTVRAISSSIDLIANEEVYANRIDYDDSGVASAIAFEPNGNYVFVALETSREVAVVDAYDATELFRVDVGRAPQGLAVSPDGLTLYTPVGSPGTMMVSWVNPGPVKRMTWWVSPTYRSPSRNASPKG